MRGLLGWFGSTGCLKMIGETITNIMDKIPSIMEFVRNGAIKIFSMLNFPDNSYMLLFVVVALVLSYYWLRQWITYSIFTRISTILNWLLLALLVYVIFVYV